MIAAGTLAAANYTFSFANGTLTIEKASLTATAANQSMAYGSAVPTLAYTLTGFKNSDTQLSATSGAPVLSTIATSASAPGKYPITIALGKLAATNYSFTLKNGTMTVTKAAQTIAFTPPPTPGVYGVLPVNLVATATSGLAVKFSVQSGPGKVVGSTLTITGAGTLVVAANQAGNSDYTAAPTITQSIVVNQATPSIGLKSSANPVALGKSVTFTATLTGAGVKPTGKVTFLDGATTLGTGTLNASGVATYTTSALAVGPHSITASYPGDSNYVAVTSAAISEAVK
jgi:hypothetical protein